MNKIKDISVVAFDADDTLWDCQSHFDRVEREYCRLLSSYADAETVSRGLFATEGQNMKLLGYGSKAFTISLVENAVNVSGGQVRAREIAQVVALGKQLLHLDATPLHGVKQVLDRLRSSGNYRLSVFTKGELLDQENKLYRSGLGDFFDDVTIVSDKTPETFCGLCDKMQVEPENLLMVGNSLKSDIDPVLRIGGWGVHVPFRVTWQHEVIDEFSHRRLVTLQHISELLPLLVE